MAVQIDRDVFEVHCCTLSRIAVHCEIINIMVPLLANQVSMNEFMVYHMIYRRRRVPEPDDLGFWFDPFDVQSYSNSLRDHFVELTFLKHSWLWIDKSGEKVDMRQIDLKYALSIVGWMEEHHGKNTPYKDTFQYRYLLRRTKVLTKKAEIARHILSRPMGWSKDYASKDTHS